MPRRATSFPASSSLSDRQQVEFYTKLQDPTAKITYQISKSNKFEAMGQVGRKWQPYRTASRYVPLESTQNQDSMSLIGPSFKYLSILSSRATFDASLQRGGYWWPDIPWTTDVRKTDLATASGNTAGATRGAFLETDRKPRRWQYGGTFAYFARGCADRNHELKTGYLGWRNIVDTENIGYPNQQQYRYRSLTGDPGCNEAANYDGCFTRPDSVLVYDYPNTTASGEWYNSLYLNDKITLSRKLTLNVGVRYDRYSSFLPEQGNPGTGPFATREHLSLQGRGELPDLLVVRAARVRGLRPDRRRTGGGARQLRPLHRRQFRRVCQSRPECGGRQPERDHHAHLFELGRPHSVRADPGQPDLDLGRRRQPLDRSGPQGTLRR